MIKQEDTRVKTGVEVKIKKLVEDAIIPEYAKAGDAGLDLTATSKTILNGIVTYGTGLSVEIPEGYVGFLYPRSSISKYDLSLCNSVGVIDSGYRGEVMLKFKVTDQYTVNQKTYGTGERVGQLIIMPFPKVSLKVVEELSDSERGNGGFGSSGV